MESNCETYNIRDQLTYYTKAQGLKCKKNKEKLIDSFFLLALDLNQRQELPNGHQPPILSFYKDQKKTQNSGLSLAGLDLLKIWQIEEEIEEKLSAVYKNGWAAADYWVFSGHYSKIQHKISQE